MKLITKQNENWLQKHPLYSQDGKGLNAVVGMKFFNPCGSGTWYVLEGKKQPNGDWLFFGLVDLFERKYGYFTLSQLQSVKLPFGLKIERDMYFSPVKVGDLKN